MHYGVSMESTGGPKILDRLDNSKTSRFYWFLTLLATIGGFFVWV